MKLFLPLAIVMMSIIGMIDAGFVTYEKLSGQLPPCMPGFRCSAVLESAWTSVGPIPLPAFGLLFYTMCITLAGALVMEKTKLTIFGKKVSAVAGLHWLGWGGLAFAGYLLLIMGVILQAWCVYCLISAVNCVVIFLLTQLLYHQANGKRTG